MVWGILGVIAVILLMVIVIYNRLVSLRNRYKNAFAQIDVQLKRRYDLIPNLVETAKEYMKHERETLEAVIKARNQAQALAQSLTKDPGDAATMGQFLGAESGLAGVLGRFFALQEGYPDLKANENMKQLSEELTSTENRIAFARQAFNDAVMVYNTARETIPAVIIASSLGFQRSALFEVQAPEERQAVKVAFG